MFSVNSEPAVNASYQPGQSRSKSARDDQAPQGDSFASMVDSNNAANTDRAAQPDAPAPRSEDRPKTAERPDDSGRNRDADSKAADAAQDAKSADTRSAQAQQKAGDKADKDAAAGDAKAKDAKDARNSASSTETKASDAKPTDVAPEGDEPVVAADAAVPAIAVNIMPIVTPIPVASAVPVTATPISGLPANPAVIDATQPLAIAAAVLKAQAAAAEANVTGTDVPAPAEAIAVDAQFAALVAAATPAAGKTGIKQATGKTDGATTGEAAVTPDANTDSTATMAATTPAAPTAVTGATTVKGQADSATIAADGKADASVADATAKPAAHAAPERNADAGPSLAPADLAPASNNLQQQPLQAAAPAALTAQQLTANIATNAPVPLNGIAVEIAQYAQAGKSRFDIRLDPAELGRIDVRLDVDRHGNVTSHLTVEKAETLAMLRQDAPQLQRALEQAGMKTSDGGLQFSLRDQSSGQQNSGDNSGRPLQRLIISEDESMPVVTAGRNYGRMLGSSRGVDISI